MKRSVLFIALLLSVVPAGAASKNYGTITTLDGRAFHECKIMRVYPNGVSFSHRDGVSKITFADLPENLRREFRYDPKAEAEYQKEQAAVRKTEQERRRQQEIVMQEQLMEARMSEASYLASAKRLATSSTSSVGYQTPSWVGTPITGPAVGGRGYGGSGYSRFGYSGYGSGYYPMGGYYSGISYGYPFGGYTYGSYPYYGGGYSFGSYPYGSYYGGGYRPSVFGSWNVGHGIRISVGGGRWFFWQHAPSPPLRNSFAYPK